MPWKKIIRLVLCAAALARFSGSAQEPFSPNSAEIELPNPSNLSTKWWQRLQIEEGSIDQRQKQLYTLLEKIAAQTSGPNQQQVEERTERIRNNFAAYAKALKQEPETLPPPPPLKSGYSIQSLLEIHRRIRTNQILMEANLGEKKDLENQIETAIQTIEKLNFAYEAIDKRSQQRQLAGLDLIAFRIAVETAKENLNDLKKELQVDQQKLLQAREEQKAATARLKAAPGESERYQELKEQALQDKKNIEEKLVSKQSENVAAFTFWHQTPQDKFENQIFQLEMNELKVRQALAENLLLLRTIEENLARFLDNANQSGAAEFTEKTRNWSKQNQLLKDRASGWERELQRTLLRIEEMLPDGEDFSPELAQLQKKALLQVQNLNLLIQRFKQETGDSAFMLDVFSQKILSIEDTFTQWAVRSYYAILLAAETIVDSATKVLFYIGTTPITLMSIITFTTIVICAFWISRLTRMAVQRISAGRRGIRRALLYRVNRLIHYSTLTIGIFIALSSIGFDFSSLVLVAGALGVGLGLGLQSIFNNFFSGLIILFESQLKVGDYIEIETGIRGEVKEINFRSTYIQTNDGVAIIVPNSEFINYKVINWTLKEPYRRIRVPFSVAYESNKDLVKRVVEEAAKTVPFTLLKEGIPAPKAYIQELGADGINFELGVWVDPKATKKQFSTNSEYLWAIHDALSKNGISIPYPQRTLRFAEDDTGFDTKKKQPRPDSSQD